jgi:anti-sigma factor ChrR (cupin superfamily)
MRLHADFSKRASVHPSETKWVNAPLPGVSRLMLDRLGGEVARATSLVRYAPGSRFSEHTHEGGEEFLVLEGVFQDESGDYPMGTYVRNPPTSRHAPFSLAGCLIFVKLWQFDPEDRQTLRRDTLSWQTQAQVQEDEVRILPLYQDKGEQVRLERWPAGQERQLKDHEGLEVLVLSGGFHQSNEWFGRYSWLRLPVGVNFMAIPGPKGACVWIKQDHLAQIPGHPGEW